MNPRKKSSYPSKSRRPGRRRPSRVAAAVRSQADCSNANEGHSAALHSGAHDRDLTVAATRNRGRTRIGKIARLPNEVREQLNQRLQDGEPGEDLLRWLNRLPKVRKVLAAQFGGRPINKQNLSDWRLGGYRDWERAEEDRARLDRLTEQAAQVNHSDLDHPLSQRLAAVLLVELARALDELRDESLPAAQRWARLRQMRREVAAMRREDHRAAKLDLERDRWWLEREQLQRENRQGNRQEFLEGLSHVQQVSQMREVLRAEKKRKKKPARKSKRQVEREPRTLSGNEQASPVKPGQGESASDDTSVHRTEPTANPKSEGRSPKED